MKKLLLTLLIGLSCLVVFSSPSAAGELDILVDKLVEKGYLSPVEAQIILDETKAAVAKEIAEGKSSSLPSWVQTIKLKGDFRLRYQKDQKKGSEVRHRGRVRYRLGVEGKVAKNVKVKAGLASGSDDPRSTNETLDDTFSTKAINLDYAHVEWTPNSKTTVVAGKFKRKPVLWQTGDILWDGDINPEGASIALTDSWNGVDVFSNSGVWILDEASGDTSDPLMFYAQPGFKLKLTDTMSLKAAAAIYKFVNIRNNSLENAGGGNTLDAAGNLPFDYDSVQPMAQIDIKKPFGGLVKYAALFGSYINNFSDGASDTENNTGYQVGFKFGDKKVSKKGTWQAKYMYTRLESDAFPDAFPDSDRYGGRTGIFGHEAILNYALKKNVILGLDWYHTLLLAGAGVPQDIVQVDVLFKF